MRLRHDLAEALRIALGELRANKTRGTLTTLGIIIGILGVVTTMTAANGVSNRFRESVGVLGSDVLYLSRIPWIITGNFGAFRNRPNLSLREIKRLEARLTDSPAVNPTASTSRQVRYRAMSVDNINIVGTTDKQLLVSNSLPELGRFVTAYDVQFKKPVCVIGSALREQLFGTADPLNKKIRIGRHAYRVVGVMEKQGSAGVFGGPDFDSQILVPISAFVRSFGGANRDINVAVKVPAGQSLESFEFELIGEIRKIRRLRPGESDDFSVNRMDALVEMFNNVMGVIVLIGILITSISLFVGGIGVMNIMFVSVTERTREIGVRKAIGARKRSIMAQFLFESSAICVLGGSIGLLAAYGVAELINRLLMPASISVPIVVIALAVSIVVGVTAGIIPAYRASRLDPIDALRYE